MEPISVSFEVGEPAPGRESMQQAQGAESYNLSPGLWLQARALSGLADFTFLGSSVGGCFAGTLATQRKQFSLLTALLFPETQKCTPSLPLPVVTPQAKANLSPGTGAAQHWRGLSAGGEDGSWTFTFQAFRQPLGCVYLPFRAPPRGARGNRHVETALGRAQACRYLRPSPRATPQLWFLKTRFPVAFRKLFWQAALGLSWDNSVLVDFRSAQNNVLWILHFSAKKMSAAKLDQTALQFFSADSF